MAKGGCFQSSNERACTIFALEYWIPESSKKLIEDKFLEEKKRIITELLSTNSYEELEERLKLIQELSSTDRKEPSEESTSNLYLKNHDMLDDYFE